MYTIAFIFLTIGFLGAMAAYIIETRSHRKTIEVAMEVNLDSDNHIHYLMDQLKEKDEHIAAIEKGRDEETECYEQQYLSFEDITSAMGEEIDNLKSSVAALRIYRDIHLYTCLPDLRSLANVKTDIETAIEQMDDTPVFYSVLSYMG